jgi:hypothetical protein
MANLAPLGDPVAEAVYADLPAAKAALQEHAKANRFAVSVDSSNAQRAFYICTKGGKYNTKGKVSTNHLSRQRRNTSTIKTDCLYRVVARKQLDGSFKTEVLDYNHNHGPVAALSALLQYRIGAMMPEEHAKVKDMMVLGYSPSQILNALQHDNNQLELIPRDIYNLLAGLQVEELDSKTPIE